MTAEDMIKNFVKLLISKLIIPDKVIPSIIESHPDVNKEQLTAAAVYVETRIAKSIDSLKVFQAELFLARIPNLEFLEVMILLYYFIIAIEKMPQSKAKTSPKNELNDAKKILRAFGYEKSEDLEGKYDIVKNILFKGKDNNENDAEEFYGNLKKILDEK